MLVVSRAVLKLECAVRPTNETCLTCLLLRKHIASDFPVGCGHAVGTVLLPWLDEATNLSGALNHHSV